MRRFAVIIAAAVAASSAATARAAAPEPLQIIPAMGAVEAGGTLVLWAPDLRSVLGHDRDGQRVWRVATGDQGGLRDLAVLGDNVLVYAGTEAILVAPADGKVLGRRQDVRLGAPGGPSGCLVRHHEGACTLACDCSFQLLRCEDLAPLGPPVRLPRVEAPGFDGDHTPQCAMFSGALVGRAGDAVIASAVADSDKPAIAAREIAIARHAKTGAELWRSTELGDFDEALSGVAMDRICYAGSRGGGLAVFDCRSGKVLWRAPIAKSSLAVQVTAIDARIFLRQGDGAAMHHPLSGEPIWRVQLPATAIALIAGASTSAAERDHPRLPSGVTLARVLHAESGEVLGDIALTPGTERWPQRFGNAWMVMSAARVDAYLDSGRSLGGLRSPTAMSGNVLGNGSHVAAWDAHTIMLGTLPSPRPKVELPLPDARVVAFEGALGPGRLVVFVEGRGAWDPKDPETFGELRWYHAVAP